MHSHRTRHLPRSRARLGRRVALGHRAGLQGRPVKSTTGLWHRKTRRGIIGPVELGFPFTLASRVGVDPQDIKLKTQEYFIRLVFINFYFIQELETSGAPGPSVMCPVARARYPLGPRWGFTRPHTCPTWGITEPRPCPRWGITPQVGHRWGITEPITLHFGHITALLQRSAREPANCNSYIR